MSEEGVELVRKAYEYWNRGDFYAFLDVADEDIVIRAAEGWPRARLLRKGRGALVFEGLAETVGHEVVIEDPIDAGDSVIVRVRARMTGEESGIEGDLESSQVVTLRKGKVVMIEYFWDHQEALEAVGLSE
jgi:ketosteroid isomerase-like protein